MNKIVEARRLPSPAPAPQALGHDGTQLWMGSRDTSRIYAIDPHTGSARDEGQAPGIPWGLTCAGDQLFVCCGEPPDDDRFIHHFTPGRGFHRKERIPAPENTGSYLGYDGDTLYLVQWYRKRILAIDESGTVGTIVNGPRGICGLVITAGRFYCVTTDSEDTNAYYLTRIDARGTEPVATDLAQIPFPARSLAYDGTLFWTNHRAADEIVAFEAPPDSF